MSTLKEGLTEKSKMKEKKLVKETNKGQRPMGKSEKVSTDRGKFTIK